jgi:parallel beta-helix repeat protein
MTRLGTSKFFAIASLGLISSLWLGGQTTLKAQVTPPPETTTIPLNTVGTTILYVNPTSGTDQAASGRTAAAPFKTLKFALDQATSGTIVQLAPGTYSTQSGEVFPLIVKAGVTVRGDEATKGQNILIQGGGDIISRTWAKQNVSMWLAQGSQVRGVTVTNNNSRGTGIWVEEGSPTISNNTFVNSVREGVFISGTASPTISDNAFMKNGGNGISVTKASGGQIKNNSLMETGFGIVINGTSAPIVDGNQIVKNRGGFVIGDSAKPVIRNNVIADSTEDGIVVLSSAQPDLGTAESSGNNTIRNSGLDKTRKPVGVDVNNTTNNTLQAIGNSIDPKKIAGRINFTPGGNVAFTDVQGHWAQQYIQALASQGIIAGFQDGTFKPNDPVTRAQFAAIVLKAFNPAARNPATTFSDVRSNFWGFAAIQSASRGGFMAGFPGGTFKPEQRIPKVQALVALSNGLEFGAGDASVLSRFQDAASIPSWAASPIAAATQRQIVVNYPTVGQLNPGRDATRAEVAAFIYQSLVSAGRAQAIPSPYVVGAAR